MLNYIQIILFLINSCKINKIYLHLLHILEILFSLLLDICINEKVGRFNFLDYQLNDSCIKFKLLDFKALSLPYSKSSIEIKIGYRSCI
jgi:hypothetical protein